MVGIQNSQIQLASSTPALHFDLDPYSVYFFPQALIGAAGWGTKRKEKGDFEAPDPWTLTPGILRYGQRRA